MKKMLLIVSLISSLIFADDFYILCEGNFGSSNASLWNYDGNDLQGPVCWDLSSNLLGDVGQSMALYNNKLLVVVNNSHKIEVMDTESQEVLKTIDMPYSNPRYLAVRGSKGYLSSWGAAGIIVIDLENYTLLDTIEVGGLPEDIIIDDNVLYTSINMNAAWASDSLVVAYDLSQSPPKFLKAYEVIPGPGRMILKDREIYVASTYYDASYNTYAGMSKILLETDDVLRADYDMNFLFSNDLVLWQDDVYRAFSDGMVKIDSDLQYHEAEKIGQAGGTVYSAEVIENKLCIGYTDYVAPDTVVVFGSELEVENAFKVGAIPGDFLLVSSPSKLNNDLKIAVDFELKQNYPNPFNPTTVIQYNLPKTAKVHLTVYNMLGEHIVDLVNENQSAGLKKVHWNATNKSGQVVPTGIYFYQLKCGEVIFTKKMIFMK